MCFVSELADSVVSDLQSSPKTHNRKTAPIMNLSKLLTHRESLRRQTYLANLGFAYLQLCEFQRRFARAGLRGPARVSTCKPEEERFCATFVVEECSPSVIEEHFTDIQVYELAEFLALAQPEQGPDFSFTIETFGERFIAPVRRELESAGVAVDALPEPAVVDQPRQPRLRR